MTLCWSYLLKKMEEKSASISIRLKPGAKKDSIVCGEDGTYTVSVTSAPIEGKANEHLIRLVSKQLRIAKSSCTIIKGLKSKSKALRIMGITAEQVHQKLRSIGLP
ncbi:MAG: DUF167 domain-containing protein [Chitinivibrionales bacterium]|nr:DUF167 domain-containing protein [Chitinivibrionales bacterium]